MRSTLEQRLEDLYAAIVCNYADSEGVKKKMQEITFEHARTKKHVTLKDAAEFLLIDRDRRYSKRDGSILSWNVKCHTYDETGHAGENVVDPALDKAWNHYMDKHDSNVFYIAVERAQTDYIEEWSQYPGIGQGDWKFSFCGRSGGWLCLSSWRGYEIGAMDEQDYIEFMAARIWYATQGDAESLSALYGGIYDADLEFTNDAAKENISVHINDQRADWESDRKNLAGNLITSLTRAAEKVLDRYGFEFSDDDALVETLNTASAKLAGLANVR